MPHTLLRMEKRKINPQSTAAAIVAIVYSGTSLLWASVIRMAINSPKRLAIVMCTYLTSELRTPLCTVLWIHDPAPNGHVA